MFQKTVGHFTLDLLLSLDSENATSNSSSESHLNQLKIRREAILQFNKTCVRSRASLKDLSVPDDN
jgi:hypothetical protein